ncbi:hypothetical protein BDZ97DRAFT_717331 [Flammula alnicola]|nr:hypothetical protein BDZ97DRAFT_717331 [Flammula alnicola]
MFMSKVLVFFIALLVGSAIAAPVLNERSDDLDLDLVERAPVNPLKSFKHAAQAVSTIAKVKNGFRPKSGEAVFWSGTRPGKKGPVSVHDDAQKFANQHGKSTINHGLAQKGIKIPSEKENPHSRRLWNVASKVWAQRASGDTHVILGGTVRPASVYNTIEKPVLLKNKKVTRLTEHNMQTGKNTVINTYLQCNSSFCITADDEPSVCKHSSILKILVTVTVEKSIYSSVATKYSFKTEFAILQSRLRQGHPILRVEYSYNSRHPRQP